MIRVHTAGTVHDFPQATRFSTEEEYNNLCVWAGTDLLAVVADGKWVMVEFTDE